MIYFNSIANNVEPKINRTYIKGVSSVQTLTQSINKTFKIALNEFQKKEVQLMVGTHLLARMKGYPPWPGKITSFTKDRSRVSCYFYGCQNNGSVSVKEILPFVDGIDTIRLLNLRRMNSFRKGVREIEMEAGVPEHLSLLKEQQAIEY